MEELGSLIQNTIQGQMKIVEAILYAEDIR